MLAARLCPALTRLEVIRLQRHALDAAFISRDVVPASTTSYRRHFLTRERRGEDTGPLVSRRPETSLRFQSRKSRCEIRECRADGRSPLMPLRRVSDRIKAEPNPRLPSNMPTACVTQPHCRISLVSQRLQVRARPNDKGVEEMGARCVARFGATDRGDGSITSQAMSIAHRGGVPISFMGWSGQVLGSFLPASNSHGLARLRQYERTRDAIFGLQMAGRIIAAKVYNQRRVLQRLAAARERRRTDGSAGSQEPDAPLDSGGAGCPAAFDGLPQDASDSPEAGETKAALVWLDQVLGNVARSSSVDELRGYEGASTARYFRCGQASFPADIRSSAVAHDRH